MRSLHPLAPLLLTAACAGCTISTGNDGFSIEFSTEAWNLRYHETEERRLDLDLGAGDTLLIEGVHGDVTVRAGDGTPTLVCVLSANGRTREEAEEILADAEILVERSGDEVTIRVSHRARRIEVSPKITVEVRASADLSATVPRGIAVRIESTSGDVELEGPLGPCDAGTSYGDVSLRRIDGRASARSGSGDIELREIQGGDVSAVTSYGDVVLEEVHGDSLEVRSSSGDVTLRDVSGRRVQVDSSYGTLELRSILGDLVARTASGDVELEDAGEGEHELRSGYGRIKVDGAAGSLLAASDSGDVIVRDMRGAVEARSGYGRVRVEGVLTAVKAESSTGDVLVLAHPGSRAAADWSIGSQYGEVEIELPEDFACLLRAHTAYGSIDSEFPLEANSDSGGAGETVAGQLGAGGATIEIHTSSGDVEIRRRD